MAGLSSPGIGSGLDINGLVSKLMDVEKAPLTALDKKEADYQAKLTAYGTLKGAFAAFQTAANGLSSTSIFTTAKASVGDAAVLSASTTSIAKPGNYSLQVSQLAQSHGLASAAFADPASAVGSGTLTIDFGTYDSGTNGFTVNGDRTATSITIDSTNNSLSGIRDAINNANAGVTASIINDGNGYRLTLKSNDSGKANSIRIQASGDGDGNDADAGGLSSLAYDPTATAGSGKNMTQTSAAQNAELSIDGIAVSKSGNTISDAITGVTLTLLKTTAVDTPTTLTVARDTSGTKTAVQGFVKAYNDMVATMKDLGGYDAKTQKGGLLLGDSTLRSMQSQVRNMLSQRLDYADGGVSSLSDIGVSFQRDGTLAIDSGKLDKVLADPSKNVAGLFAAMGVPSDSLVSYAGSSSYTQAGRYGLEITQVATQGNAVGQVPVAASTVISGTNNTLSLTLNGVAATVTLDSGTYSREELIAEIQSKINSDSSLKALGHKVSVAETAGAITLTSTLYGSGSRVEVSGGSAAATLFGSTVSTAGLNVAGTLGGLPATGSGQLLTGTGDASGLQLLVLGGNTGARGTVGFSRGIAWQLNQTLTTMLGDNGTLAGRTDGIDSSIKDIDSRRAALNLRLAEVEKRYRAQFTALDSMVASMQQTSTYLTQQLASLTAASGK